MNSAYGDWLRGSLWAWPALEVVHIAGIALLFGSLVLLELRVLGLAPTLPLPALARLALPLTLGGFALAASSGLLMFAADPGTLLVHPAFRWKMLLLALAGLNAALFHARGGLARCDAPARVQVVLSLSIWLGVILAGRLIAYL